MNSGFQLVGYDSDFYNRIYGSFPIKRKRKKVTRNPISKKQRLHEKYNGICQLCQEPVSLKEFTIDHIIPKSKGGSNKWPNLQIAHSFCNCIKGSDEQQAPEHYINHPLYNYQA